MLFGLILEWTFVCDVVNVVFLFSNVFNPILRIDLNLFTLSPLGWSLLLFSVFVLVSVSSNVWCHFIICLCKEQGTKMLMEEARVGGGEGGGVGGGGGLAGSRLVALSVSDQPRCSAGGSPPRVRACAHFLLRRPWFPALRGG